MFTTSATALLSAGHATLRQPPPFLSEPEQVVASHNVTLTPLLATFDPIDLAQMDRAALLNRVETKYMMPMNTLVRILGKVQESYRVLEVAGYRHSRYRTLYFDTADFALYRRHHAGVLNRYKVRVREYLDAKGAFLEVKHKTNKNRTVKIRMPTPELITTLNEDAANFLQEVCPYAAAELQPALWNGYTRITLVNRTGTERVTLDSDLHFAGCADQARLPGLVIAEVKQADRALASPFMRLMRTEHALQSGFSKYCIGFSLLYPTIKHNNFKATHRLVAKVMQGGNGDTH